MRGKIRRPPRWCPGEIVCILRSSRGRTGCIARRRAWARGLSSTAEKEYEPLVAARTRLLVEKVGEQEGEVVLDKWFDKFA